MADNNQGVKMYGGNFSAGVAAIGPNANARQYGGSGGRETELQSINAKLDELEKAIVANAAALRESQELIGVTQMVRKELASEKPNRSALKSLFSGITRSVGCVSSIAELAKTIEEAVHAFT
jgi:hypothetical protein